MTFPFSVQKGLIPSGPPFQSIPVDIQSLTLASNPPTRPVYKGDGFGFALVPLYPDRPFAASIKLNILGYGKQGNQDIQVVPNVWYEGPFSGIEVRPQTGGYTEIGNTFIAVIALTPYASARPVSQLTTATLPAAMGGAPTVQTNGGVSEPLTGAVPTLIGDTRALAISGPTSAVGTLAIPFQAASMFQVVAVSESVAGGLITGGSIDLYQYVYERLGWVFVGNYLLQIPSSGSGEAVSTPAGYLGVRQPLTVSPVVDKFLAVPNAVTYDDGTATVNIILRLQ